MSKQVLTVLTMLALALGGCARWKPESGQVKLVKACPLKKAPSVEDFGQAGIKGVYHFVTQDAPDADLGALLSKAKQHKFDIMLMTININGKDTLFGQSAAVLHNQAEVDQEFKLACSLGQGKVFLTHVRYNAADEKGGEIRVR